MESYSGVSCGAVVIPSLIITDTRLSSVAFRVFALIQAHGGKASAAFAGIDRSEWIDACKQLMQYGWMERKRTDAGWMYCLTAGQPVPDTMVLEDENRPITVIRDEANQLVSERLVRIVSQQDRADVEELIDNYGLQAIKEKAVELSSVDNRAVYPSALRKALEPARIDRSACLKVLRQALRDKYELESFISNALLDQLIERCSGWAKQFDKCQAYHGSVTRAWIEESIKDKSIVESGVRSDEWLQEQVEKVRGKG